MAGATQGVRGLAVAVAVAVGAALLAAACAPPPVARQRQTIIGGSADTADPAVVMLVAYDAATYDTCSAALIAPTLLVTAAHCVDPTTHAGKTFGAFFGADASAWAGTPQLADHLAAVAAVHAHPSYNPAAPFTADIGVALLVDAAAPAPLPIALDPLPATLAGAAARIVGYGQTTYGQANVAKYQAATTVVQLDAGDTLTVGDASHHSCVGDSGGPALVTLGGTETVVGVDSYTDTVGCTQAAHYRRVDLYLDFLRLYAPLAAPDLGAPLSDLAPAAGHDLAGRDLGGLDLAPAPADLTAPRDAPAPPDLAARDLTAQAAARPTSGGCQTTPIAPTALWVTALLLYRRRRPT